MERVGNILDKNRLSRNLSYRLFVKSAYALNKYSVLGSTDLITLPKNTPKILRFTHSRLPVTPFFCEMESLVDAYCWQSCCSKWQNDESMEFFPGFTEFGDFQFPTGNLHHAKLVSYSPFLYKKFGRGDRLGS